MGGAVGHRRRAGEGPGALDTHGWGGPRAPYFREVMAALRGADRQPTLSTYLADALTLARLHERIPTYAVYPNLAWQEENHSDLLKGTYSTYQPDGIQKPAPYAVTGLLAECLGGKAFQPVKEESEKKRAWFRFGPMPSLAEAARRRAEKAAVPDIGGGPGDSSSASPMPSPPERQRFCF